MKTKLLTLALLLGLIPAITDAQCDAPSVSAELNIGNVRASVFNGGDFWWDGVETGRYVIPKVDPSSGITPINVIFAGAIWMSAVDASGDLKVAGMTYRAPNRHDYYPGPIDNITGSTDFATCSYFNQIWQVHDADIENHVALANQGLPLSLSQIHPDILSWPAKGNPYILAYNIDQDLAPFEDVNQNGIYDPQNGDFPRVYGDQALFWVFNDIGGPHGRTGGEQLGVEVHMLAYAFDSTNPILQNTTMYECKIINKSFGNLSDFRFGLFVDPDLGVFFDDYIGCDTTKNTAFVYNANAIDTQQGSNPPIMTTTFLNKEMTGFVYFNNAQSGPQVDPNTSGEFSNYLQGLWNDGNPITEGGNGYNTGGGVPTSYVYPGNPASAGAWSECSISNPPGDRRFLQSSGPYPLGAWDSFEIAWAVHGTFPTNYTPCFDFNSTLLPNVDAVQEFYNNKSLNYNHQVVTGIKRNNHLSAEVSLFPNPGKDQISIDFGTLNFGSLAIIGIDGKVVLQMSDLESKQKISIQDLSSGLYYLQLEFTEGKAVKKLMVK